MDDSKKFKIGLIVVSLVAVASLYGFVMSGSGVTNSGQTSDSNKSEYARCVDNANYVGRDQKEADEVIEQLCKKLPWSAKDAMGE